MTFDEWTTEAHRSLQAWNPEPAVRPAAAMARSEAGGRSAADPVATSAYAELAPARGRPPASTRRRLLAAVAAAAIVAAALAAMAVPRAGTDVAVGPQTAPTRPAARPSEAVGAPSFECAAADPERGASTDVFRDATDVAGWRAGNVDDLLSPGGAQPSPNEPVNHATGTLAESPGEDRAETTTRAAAFVAAVAPGWTCTVWSPEVDAADRSRPGPIVDEHNVVTNRLGGMCFVPDASADPDSVWGVDPSLAAALDQVDGLTAWNVILADGGGNRQDPGRRWLEFTFEADPGAGDSGSTTRVLAAVSAAVDAAGAAAGVPTECSPTERSGPEHPQLRSAPPPGPGVARRGVRIG
ncbi:MAG TPA: hypothetical protein VNQ33_03860 [Acidimicrobiales bacterium]|nr:hypothetical protein [Acidimicrobiales bacterium]